MRTSLIVGLWMLLSASCVTRQAIDACGSTGYSSGEPVVELLSVTQAKDSPARGAGYPIFQFPLPVYPSDMARAGVTGEARVRLTIDTDGRVKEASIVKSSLREFEGPVLDATRLWRFKEMPEFPLSDPKGLIVDCVFTFSFSAE
jgi:TonB family protein